jgi:hypothetical protein
MSRAGLCITTNPTALLPPWVIKRHAARRSGTTEIPSEPEHEFLVRSALACVKATFVS